MTEPIPEMVRKLERAVGDVLRDKLAQRDKDWLVDEVVRLMLKGVSLAGINTLYEEIQLADFEQAYTEQTAEERSTRFDRVHAMHLDEPALHLMTARLRARGRAQLEEEDFLVDAPAPGGALITTAQRSDVGNALLREAKDVLYALLFGTPEMNVMLKRTERELLQITIPRPKRAALDFMAAVSELTARGSWRDPRGHANDEQVANVVLAVEYGEVASEAVGRGIAACLCVINDLEVNEVVLYSHTVDVEDSSLHG